MADTHVYFSDRESGPNPPIHHEMDEPTWRGLTALVQSCITKGHFGNSFPEGCPEAPSTCCGTNVDLFNRTLEAVVPAWPGWDTVPDVATACDFLEFCHRHIAHASSLFHHEFLRHHHFQFNVEAGRRIFRDNVNHLLQRNRIRLRMTDAGRMERMLDDPTGEVMHRARFRTGDTNLDRLIEEARTKFMSPNPRLRQEALEKAWDAWERLKTVRCAEDKKRGVTLILDQCATDPQMRLVLEAEAKALTDIGNTFQIRHSEVNKPEIVDSDHIDYVFQRLFTMLLLILRRNDMLA